MVSRSGCGYMFPSHWPAEDLPDFLQRTGQLMQTMHLNVLEVLDSASTHSGSGMAFPDPALQQRFVHALLPFCLPRILTGAGQSRPSSTVSAGVPVFHNLALIDNVSKPVTLLRHPASPT